MALRHYWKGYLKFSLVTCPVQMMPATSENEKVRFHSTLNRETQNRASSASICGCRHGQGRSRKGTKRRANSVAKTTTSSSRM